MMEPLEPEVVDKVGIYMGYAKLVAVSLSLLCLVIFSGALMFNKTLRYSERNMVHLNLAISMIFVLITYLLVDYFSENELACKILGFAQHYFNIVAYAWIFIEALCLFYAVLYDELNQKMKCYAPFGWLLPAIFVGVFGGMYHDKYGLNDRCWITYEGYLILAMIVPILAFLLFNMAVLLIVICNLPSPQLKRQDILAEIRTAIKLTIVFTPVLMFMWSIALIQVTRLTTIDLVFGYIFTGLFSLQGVFVFLIYGIGQRSIRMALMRKKYQPTLLGQKQALIQHGGSVSSSEDSMRDLVDVKPQPMQRPPSSKSKNSPRPDTPIKIAFSASSGRRGSKGSRGSSARSARRRSSNLSDSPAYIP